MNLRKLNWLQERVTRLSKQLERRRADRELQSQGALILYALDNDVMTCVTAPWLCRDRHYLRSALVGNRDAREALAYILAEYFIRDYDRAERLPFVMLSPTETEAQGIWNTVYAEARKQLVNLDTIYEDLATQLGRHLSADKLNEQAVIVFARELLECIHQRRGAIAELQRISRVQNAASIVPLTRLTIDGQSPIPRLTQQDNQRLQKFRQDWLRELNFRRPPARIASHGPGPAQRLGRDERHLHDPSAPTNNEYDAELMAHIEVYNLKFAQEALANTPPTRICLVTGDRNIEQIASTRPALSSTVAVSYVRSPICFLADVEFFAVAGVRSPEFLAEVVEPDSGTPSPADDQPTLPARDHRPQAHGSILDWLRVLLLSEAVRPPDPNLPSILSELDRAIDQWVRYLESAAADAGFREAREVFDRRIATLTQGARQNSAALISTLTELQEQVQQISSDAMTRFGVAGVLAGFWSLPKSGRWPSRIVPAVQFDKFAQANRLVEELLDAGTLDSAKEMLTRSRIRVLRTENPNGYTVFTVFSLAFALAGRWQAAYTVARAAFSIAVNRYSAALTPRPKGDEAAYLCAVCCHASAKGIEDLNECDNWLLKVEALQRQPQPGEVTVSAPSANEELRVKVEQLALQVTRLNFSVFSNEATGLGDLIRAKSKRNLCTQHLSLLKQVGRIESKPVHRSVVLQAATNFLQLQLHAELDADPGSIMPADISDCLAMVSAVSGTPFGEQTDFPQRNSLPALTRFVCLCAIGVFWKVLERQYDVRDPAFLTIVESVGQQVDVMPYDAQRVRRLLILVRSKMPPSL